jgi:hypothetical protein
MPKVDRRWRDAPVFRAIYSLLFVLFLLGVTQVRG